MNISVQKLLSKMDSELKQAQLSQEEESLREKIYSIKILCELILDEQQIKSGKNSNAGARVQPVPYQHPYEQPGYQPAHIIQQPAAVPQQKKLEMEDGANGDSLFDF